MSHHSAADLQKLRSRGFVPRYPMLPGGETFSKLCVTAAFVYLARGEQRWEFIPSSATAAVTIAAAAVLGHQAGRVGAAAAIVFVGLVNTILAASLATQRVGHLRLWAPADPVVAVTAAGVVAGIIGTRVDGPLRGTVAACLPMAIVAARQRDAVFALVREGVRL